MNSVQVRGKLYSYLNLLFCTISETPQIMFLFTRELFRVDALSMIFREPDEKMARKYLSNKKSSDEIGRSCPG